MCLRFVVFWILVNGLIPLPSPFPGGQKPSPTYNLPSKIISKSDKATMKLMSTAFYKQCANNL